jgi:GAF domain-containing protein
MCSVSRVSRVTSSSTPLCGPAVWSHRRAVDRAARQAFPQLADFCLIHVAAPRTLRCVVAAHRVPTFSRDMRALVAAPRIRRDDLSSTVACVVRSGKPALRTEIRPEIYSDDERLHRRGVTRIQQRLAPTSALVVPVLGEGIVLGTVSLCYSHSGRTHGPQHVPLAERFAARIAAALVAASNAASRLRSAARHARQRRTVRRRLASRD